jgi:glycine hydroxymethyltransferase
VTSTTHKTLRGPRGGIILSKGQDEDFYKKLNSAVFPGIQGGPLMHVIAAKAVAFKEALSTEFKTYQRQVVANARAMAAVLQQRGLQDRLRRHRQPSDADRPLRQTLHRQGRGRRIERRLHHGEQELGAQRPAFALRDLGLRIGTPAVTTRGFGVPECEQLAGWLCDVLDAWRQST